VVPSRAIQCCMELAENSLSQRFGLVLVQNQSDRSVPITLVVTLITIFLDIQ
jgi:hypothetical protein